MDDRACRACKRPVDPEEAFCFGCKSSICGSCDINPQMGQHVFDDHLDDTDLRRMSNDITQIGTVVFIDDVICKRDTAKAILVTINAEDHWIPVSQLDDQSEVQAAGDVGTLAMTAWIARQKGLIE